MDAVERWYHGGLWSGNGGGAGEGGHVCIPCVKQQIPLRRLHASGLAHGVLLAFNRLPQRGGELYGFSIIRHGASQKLFDVTTFLLDCLTTLSLPSFQ